MALFKRKKGGTSNIPTEVQDYYQAQQRDRTGIAWLLALGTLVITILLALGLFIGGRWVYRKIANNDTSKTPNNGEVAQNPRENEDARQPESSTSPQTPTPQTTPTPSPGTPNTSQPSSTPNTGTPSDLPNTGSAEVISTFLITTAAGTVLYQIRLRRAAKNS